MNIEFEPPQKPLHVGFQALSPQSIIPFTATPESNGYDLFTIEEVTIEPEHWKVVKLGFAVEVPVNHAMLVLPKSGLSSKHGISVLNSPGLVDSDYRGEISAIVINHNDAPYTFKAREKIAQVIFVETKKVEFWPVDKLSETERGEGGFGSTGR